MTDDVIIIKDEATNNGTMKRATISGRRANAAATADAIMAGISYTAVKEAMEHLKNCGQPHELEDAEAYLHNKFMLLVEGRQERDDYTEVFNNDLFIILDRMERRSVIRMYERQVDTAYLQGYIAGALDRDGIMQQKVFAKNPHIVIEP